jgi:hypothetical protein
MAQIISREASVEDLIKSWILAHVRQQKSIRRAVDSYPMKGVVERELGRYITEKQFIDCMIELGYRQEDGYFNSILVSKFSPEKDKQVARLWGMNKQSITRWMKNNS